MEKVTIRELRNHGGDVIERVEGGERLIVTRSGRPVAELRPLSSGALSAEALLVRWRSLPPLSLAALRADLDNLVDSEL